MNCISNSVVVLLGLLASIAWAQSSTPSRVIEVFTDSPALIYPVTGAEVIHYDLSESDRLKRSALPVLPPNQEKAMRIIKAFFNSPEGQAFQRNMRVALEGKRKMIQYQLQKIPAIVFDQGKYAVYGMTDVHEATRLYGLYLQQNQSGNSVVGDQ